MNHVCFPIEWLSQGRWSLLNQQDFYGCWNGITGLLLEFHICLDEGMAQSRPPVSSSRGSFCHLHQSSDQQRCAKSPVKRHHLHVFRSVQLYSSRLLYQPPGAPGTSELCQPAANPNQVTPHHRPSWISSLKCVSNHIPVSSPRYSAHCQRSEGKKQVLTLRS